MNRVKNFNAGPAALPLPALERAREEFLDFAGSGMSVMEHSHRGKEYEACHDEATALLKELLAVPDTHEVLFVQGGASQLFAQIPMNLVQKGGSADYVVTGAWSEKAVSEARMATAMLGGSVRVACSTGSGDGKEKSYVRAPAPGEVKAADGAAYLHLTSNETIHGVQFDVYASRPYPATGAVLWDQKIRYTTAGVINTPVVLRDRVFTSCGYGAGCTILRIDKVGVRGLRIPLQVRDKAHATLQNTVATANRRGMARTA